MYSFRYLRMLYNHYTLNNIVVIYRVVWYSGVISFPRLYNNMLLIYCRHSDFNIIISHIIVRAM